MQFKTNDIIQIANQLKAGKIGLFPCDTVWGIIAILNEENIRRCRELKGKDSKSPLLVLIPDSAWVSRLCQPLTQDQEEIVEQRWPGPSTFIFQGSSQEYPLPSDDESIGLRVPEFLPLNLLLDSVQMPVLSTSANLTGQASIKNPSQLDDRLSSQLDFIYDKGKPLYDQASAVIDVRESQINILRQGPHVDIFD